jgi:hypothetical protein
MCMAHSDVPYLGRGASCKYAVDVSQRTNQQKVSETYHQQCLK